MNEQSVMTRWFVLGVLFVEDQEGLVEVETILRKNGITSYIVKPTAAGWTVARAQ